MKFIKEYVVIKVGGFDRQLKQDFIVSKIEITSVITSIE